MKKIEQAALAASTLLLCMAASAQSRSGAAGHNQVPDYAAVLGAPLVVTDARTGQKHALTDAEIKRQVERKQNRRTAREREASLPVNRMIHAMPATDEEARREATVASDGTVTTLVSREQLQPMYGMKTPGGGLRASHEPVPANHASR